MAIRTLALFLATAALLPVETPLTIFRSGPDIGIDGQPGWSYYPDLKDGPGGAYMGWLNPATSVTATMPLGQTLPPGTYRVFIKALNYLVTYPGTVELGSSGATTLVNSGDWNGRWTEAIVLTTAQSASTLKMTFTTDTAAPGRKVLLQAVCITTDPKAVVTATDTMVSLDLPAVDDSEPPQKGNLIRNASFEAGVDASWGFHSGIPLRMSDCWKSGDGAHGEACLEFPTAAPNLQIVSRSFRLAANRTHTASVWMKAAPGQSESVTLSLWNLYTPPPGYPSHSVKATFTVRDSWTRLQVTGAALAYPTSDYEVHVYVRGGNPGWIRMDAVQLEEGDLTDFAPAATAEACLMSDTPGRVFFDTEPVQADLRVCTQGHPDPSVRVDFEIRDHRNRLVRSGSAVAGVFADGVTLVPFDLSTGARGAFRIVYGLAGGDVAEWIYSVVPPPVVAGLDPASFMGVHPDFVDFQLETLARLGMKWARVLSPAAFFRWNVVEPQDDAFKWYDTEVQRAAKHGISIMGNLASVGAKAPTWAMDPNGLPNLAEWSEFVGQIVAHYKPWVKCWEIWNEPQYSFTPDFYAKLLKAAADAIEAADPSATIIAMGGVDATYASAVISELKKQFPGWDCKAHLDAIAVHCYPGGYSMPPVKALIDAEGEPVWNTETGCWDLGFYQGAEANYFTPGESLFPHRDAVRFYRGMVYRAEQLVQNFVGSIAYGMTKYFYYDSRNAAAPDYLLTHPTMFEHDRSVRVKGVAYAVAGHFLDHAVSKGPATFDSTTQAFVFQKGTTPILVLWTSDRQPKSLALGAGTGSVRVFDLMGNEMTVAGAIPYGRTPVYVAGAPGASIDAFRAAVQASTSAPRVDGEPPALSFSEFPRRPVRTGSFRVRWIAADDTSVPEDGIPQPEQLVSDGANPLALLYSYRLVGNGEDWSDWTPGVTADYQNLADGRYRMEVRVRDEAGNETMGSVPIVVGDVPPEDPGTFGGGGSHGRCGSLGVDLLILPLGIWLMRRRARAGA